MNSTTFKKSAEKVLREICEETVPSGIFIASPASLRNNDDEHGPIKQETWEKQYRLLKKGIIKGSKLSSRLVQLSDIRERVDKYAKQNLVPIAVIDLMYHAPVDKLIMEWQSAKQENREISLEQPFKSMLFSQRVLSSCALLPREVLFFDKDIPMHAGLTVRFMIPRDLYLTGNIPDGHIQEIRVNWGDGTGWKTVEWDQISEVNYKKAGEKSVQVEFKYPDTRLTAQFSMDIKDITLIDEDTSKNITATECYYDPVTSTDAPFASGEMHIFYRKDGYLYLSTDPTKIPLSTNTPYLTNPIVICDGFNSNYNQLKNGLCEHGFLQGLLDGAGVDKKGYDVVLLTYNDSTTYIQSNALMAVECIRTMLAESIGGASLDPGSLLGTHIIAVCGGVSMGGLVMRYALCHMESRGENHGAQIYLSYDTPHQGADLPLGIQHCMRVNEDSLSGDGAAQLDLLNSIACQQMLKYWLKSEINMDQLDKTFDCSLGGQDYNAYRAQFLQDLDSYPEQVNKKIALANGSGIGLTLFQPLEKTVNIALTLNGLDWIVPDIWTKSYPLYSSIKDSGNNDIVITRMAADELDVITPICLSVKPSQVYDCDIAPGGTKNSWGLLADQVLIVIEDMEIIEIIGVNVETLQQNSSFVNTISALDIKNASLSCHIVPGMNTEFDAYHADIINTPHATITYRNMSFVYQQLELTAIAPEVLYGGEYNIVYQYDGDSGTGKVICSETFDLSGMLSPGAQIGNVHALIGGFCMNFEGSNTDHKINEISQECNGSPNGPQEVFIHVTGIYWDKNGDDKWSGSITVRVFLQLMVPA